MKLPRFLRDSRIIAHLVAIEDEFRRQQRNGNFTLKINFLCGRCEAVNVGSPNPDATFQVKEDLTDEEVKV